jgi:hypothetical protein
MERRRIAVTRRRPKRDAPMLDLLDQLYGTLYYASLVFFLPLIIAERKRPAEALFWMVLVMFLPYFLGPPAYLMLGTDRIKNKGIKKLYSNRMLRQKLQEEEATLAAQHHINMEYYIFMPDNVGAHFRDLLSAAGPSFRPTAATSSW